jgi:hypothetical protein
VIGQKNQTSSLNWLLEIEENWWKNLSIRQIIYGHRAALRTEKAYLTFYLAFRPKIGPTISNCMPPITPKSHFSHKAKQLLEMRIPPKEEFIFHHDTLFGTLQTYLHS